MEWFKYLSWFNYGNELLLINQWKGVELDCAEGDLCTYENGEAVIDFYGYSEVRTERPEGKKKTTAIWCFRGGIFRIRQGWDKSAYVT